MDFRQSPAPRDGRDALTPRQAIDRVRERAEIMAGPIGLMNFEFIPLADEGGDMANWDLSFHAAPAEPELLDHRRKAAIERAIAEVRLRHPVVRWP